MAIIYPKNIEPIIDDDELVEITPKSIRMRKRILGTEARKKLEARKKNG